MCAYRWVRNVIFSENFAFVQNEWPLIKRLDLAFIYHVLEPTYLKNILDALKNKLVDTEIFETILTTSKENGWGRTDML